MHADIKNKGHQSSHIADDGLPTALPGLRRAMLYDAFRKVRALNSGTWVTAGFVQSLRYRNGRMPKVLIV